jgi:hypothetical protein
MTQEQADAELAQIAKETPTNAVDVTRLFGGME